jgi:hypothetical protein
MSVRESCYELPDPARTAQQITKQAVAQLPDNKSQQLVGPILQQLVAKIPWGHNILLMEKVTTQQKNRTCLPEADSAAFSA